MEILKRMIRPVLWAVRRQKVLRALPQLKRYSSHEPIASRIATAIEEVLSGKFSARECEHIAQIEALRTQLLANESSIDVVDYGAGHAGDERDLDTALAGHTSARRICDVAKASKSWLHCRLLFKLTRHLEPNRMLEMGTCVGISGSYLAAALEMNGKGRLVTIEGAQAIAEVAHSTFDHMGFNRAEIVTGPFQKVLVPALEGARPVDFIFNDGHHDGEAVLNYFEASRDALAPTALIFVDDIRWSPSMFDAWNALRRDASIRLSIDFGSTGLLVWRPQGEGKRSFSMKI